MFQARPGLLAFSNREISMIEALLSLFLSVFGVEMPTPIAVSLATEGVVVLHEDGMLSEMFPLQEEGIILASFSVEADDQGQPSEPLPVLSTSWVDVLGVQHQVTTPIPSSTPAGIQKAVALHNQLVGILQQAHPPRPPSP